MDKLKISVYVITYNEEAKIRECLESVKWADEIIVADSYSTDKTVEIAKEYTDKIYQIKFNGFGDLRNEAISYAANEWILSVDADERVTPEFKREIEDLLKVGPSCDAYYVPRISHFLKYRVRHCGWYPDYRQPQFFKKSKMKYTRQLVHETFELDGKLGYLKQHILQFPFFSLDQFLKKMDRYSNLRADEMYAQGKKSNIFKMVLNPAAMFYRMYIAKLGFLDGQIGLMLSILYGYYTFIKYIKLWEKNLSSAS